MGSKLIPKTKKPKLQSGDKIKSIGTVEKVGTYKGDLKGMMNLPLEKRKIQEGRDKATRDEYVKSQEAKEKPKLVAKNKKGGKNWIQKAVNPKHKGYCTPMTKSTCTPRRKALAKTFKKHHGFHKNDGGEIEERGNTVAMAQQGMAITPNNGYIRGWFNAQPPRGIPYENTSGYGNQDYYPELQKRTAQQLTREHIKGGLNTAAKLGATAAMIGGGAAAGSLPAMALGAGRVAALPFTGAFTGGGMFGGQMLSEGLGNLMGTFRNRKPLPLSYPDQPNVSKLKK